MNGSLDHFEFKVHLDDLVFESFLGANVGSFLIYIVNYETKWIDAGAGDWSSVGNIIEIYAYAIKLWTRSCK